jgi:hypothetical protein
VLTVKEVQSLAQEGAAVEILQLEHRLAALRAEFPRAATRAAELRRKGFTPGPGRPRRDDPRRRHDQPRGEIGRAQGPAAAPLAAAADAAPRRRRPPISEAHKRAIARAQRARWRKVKNERARR